MERNMTAEIAIMNKIGVALAADSAVSIGGENVESGPTKVYNSVNKLFALSRCNPVGIMIYGRAEFLAVPWESIIKLYQEQIRDIIRGVFSNLPISDGIAEQLEELCGLIFHKDDFPVGFSGIVIAGFGENEVFPSLVSYQLEGIVANRLKYKVQQNV